MDSFFSETQKSYFEQFESLVIGAEANAVTLGMDAEQLIDDTDEVLHDRLSQMVEEKPRIIDEVLL